MTIMGEIKKYGIEWQTGSLNANKKYREHRVIPETIWKDLDDDNTQYGPGATSLKPLPNPNEDRF